MSHQNVSTFGLRSESAELDEIVESVLDRILS